MAWDTRTLEPNFKTKTPGSWHWQTVELRHENQDKTSFEEWLSWPILTAARLCNQLSPCPSDRIPIIVLPAWASETPLVWWEGLDNLQPSGRKSVKVCQTMGLEHGWTYRVLPNRHAGIARHPAW